MRRLAGGAVGGHVEPFRETVSVRNLTCINWRAGAGLSIVAYRPAEDLEPKTAA